MNGTQPPAFRLRPFAFLTLFIGMAYLAGCDTVTGPASDDSAESAYVNPGDRAPASPEFTKLQHPQLLEQARSERRDPTAGKTSGEEIHLYLAFNLYEEDGITRRMLDKYGITRRLMDKYGDQIRLKLSLDRAVEGLTVAIDAGLFEVFMADIEADPDFLLVEPDAAFQLTALARFSQDPADFQLVPWGLDRIAAADGAAVGEKVRVYVLDSGIHNYDLNVAEQKDFTMLFLNRDQAYIDEEEILRMPYFDPGTGGNPADESGHGSHVAGTIGALNNETGVLGVAPGVRIHSLKVLTAEGRTDLTTVLAALDYVIHEKLSNPNTPMVVNLSLGADIGTTAYNVLDRAIQQSIAAGVVVVVSAGNNGADAATYSPAHVAEAITVGAYDLEDRFASFSNHGAVVDITAPGDWIVSLTHLPEEATRHENILMSGTSFAAPHVTGAVARFLTQHPQASPAQVQQALLATGRATVREVPPGTTAKTVYVGSETGLAAAQVPPFFQYALLSEGSLESFHGAVRISAEGTVAKNANVFTNGNLVLDYTRLGTDPLRSTFERHAAGFGYYAGYVTSEDEATRMFRPKLNPTGLPAYQKVDRIEIPHFDAAAFRHVAQGEDKGLVRFSGNHTLGTKENPVLWFVDGDVVTTGKVTFKGYGVLFTTGNIIISHDFMALEDTGETTLGLYAGGSITFNAREAALSAQLFSNGDVTLRGNTTIYGSVTTGGKMRFEGNTTLVYRPASPALTEAFWPMHQP